MQNCAEHKTLQIDVDSLLRQRLPRLYGWLPRMAVRWIERTIHQDELNELLRAVGNRTGVAAADAALSHMGIKLNVSGLEHLPKGRRLALVSNHPLGGLDGLALISIMGHQFGPDGIRFMVNDLLMVVEPLRCLFLPVNKYGRQSRTGAGMIEREWAGERQMLTFPAGLCSRMRPDGSIHDLPWRKSFVTHAVASRRDVVPIYFNARNSGFFYRLAKFRERIGLKFNIEMIYLPSEMLKLRGATLNISIGEPIAWSSLDAAHPAQEARRLCDMAYALGTTV